MLHVEYVPCPLVEIKNGRKKILEQPVDLTNLTAAMADAAVNFIDEKTGIKIIIMQFVPIALDIAIAT